MGLDTAIGWTDHTVNFWWGCMAVGPGCDHCYAEAWDKRTGGAHWGPHAPRRFIKSAPATLAKIQRGAAAHREAHGRAPRVFMQSMSDVFDNVVTAEQRAPMWAGIDAATECNIQLLTKRVGNVAAMIPVHWRASWPRHVGLMITVVNQEEAERDIPKLLDLKYRLGIPWVGLSIEPMLGPIDLTEWLHDSNCVIRTEGVCICCPPGEVKLDWVIVGGESGGKARPMRRDWVRDIRDQCIAACVPFFFKQWGEYAWAERIEGDPSTLTAYRPGRAAAGRLLDGRTWDEQVAA